jgi:hypothetical protein
MLFPLHAMVVADKSSRCLLGFRLDALDGQLVCATMRFWNNSMDAESRWRV